MSNQAFTYGTAQKLTANAFTRTGYTFAGWNTKADGSGTSYDNGESVSNLTTTNGGTVTLYAKWTPINYPITYHLNGGTLDTDKNSYTIESPDITLGHANPHGLHLRWLVRQRQSDGLRRENHHPRFFGQQGVLGNMALTIHRC